MMKRIYLDRISSTPVHPEVLKSMQPFFIENFGNPQSMHREGQVALRAISEARIQVSKLIGARPDEVYFVASGSEANNMAIKGLALAQKSRGNHVVVSAIEHVSVLNSVKWLERFGFRHSIVPVDKKGVVDLDALAGAILPETVLVSVMLANSEIGTIEPVAEMAALCRKRGILFHTDAVAAAGNIPIDVNLLGVDALSLAADQFYGPKGAAALFIKGKTKFTPLLDGGNQEGGRRAGTENVPAIVGLGKAAELALDDMKERSSKLSLLRDRLLDELPRQVDHVVITGSRENRLPYHASFCIEFVEGESMLLSLDLKGIAVSSGSACTSRSLKASHVLLALGIDHALAQGSLVFSLLDETTPQDIDYLLETFPPIVDRLRAMSPLYTEFLKQKEKR